jgi:hypothetical protein
MKRTDIFRGLGVEIDLSSPENFLKIKETLTRIGISSHKGNILYQSCHILHKKDRTDVSIEGKSRYAILHFKELFILDGKENTFSDEDKGRRNTIVNLLEEWDLVKVLDPVQIEHPIAPLSKIKILSHKEKDTWNLQTKYTIGTKKGRK